VITVELKIPAHLNDINEMRATAVRVTLSKIKQLEELMEDIRDLVTGEGVKIKWDMTRKGVMVYVHCSDSVRAEVERRISALTKEFLTL
jgi:L-lactate utilization protein LutB